MGLDEEGVGIFLEHRLQTPEMSGALHDPALGRAAPLQQLEQLAVKGISRSHVRLVDQPMHIALDGPLGGEDRATEVARHDADTFLWKLGPHAMPALEVGNQSLRPVDRLLDLGDSRVARMARALGRRMRTIDLPGEWHAIGRVEGEQLVQDGRARTSLAADEDRSRDRLLSDLGMPRVPVDHVQAVLETSRQVAACDHPADQAEPRVFFE
jgi:hypothetical protein